jgi:hypothetical protein
MALPCRIVGVGESRGIRIVLSCRRWGRIGLGSCGLGGVSERP